jgi:hypothetical protein
VGKEAVLLHVRLYQVSWLVADGIRAVGPYGAEDVTRAYVDDYSGAGKGRRRAYGWKDGKLRTVSRH